jgi:hypothetical protein
MVRRSSRPTAPRVACALLVGALVISGLAAVAASDSTIAVESFDSGTRVVREIAEALTGEGRGILECYPLGSNLFLGLVNLFSATTRIRIVEWGMRLSVGHDPEYAERLDVCSLPQWCVDQYPETDPRYDAIVLGSPNGAVAHLAALLHAPFLTTSFGLTFRQPTIDADDLPSYLSYSRRLIETILRTNKDVDFEIVSHYDPLHDRSLVKFANFLRIKLHELPGAYEHFIEHHLAPEGKLILIDCGYSWPQYVLGDRAFLQVGGLGGIPSEAFHERWSIQSPIQVRRESEWGCPESFAASARDFAASRGIDVVEISYDHPQEYSLLAYEAYLGCRDVRRETLLIDCFNHQNPRTNVETGIPALWLPFNTIAGLAFARDALEDDVFDQIYFTQLPAFSSSPDTARLAPWIDLLSRHGDLEIVGIDRNRFPTDPLAPFRFSAWMASLRRTHHLEAPLYLNVETLGALLSPGRCGDPDLEAPIS